MPSWLKRRFQILKRDVLTHLVFAKGSKQLLPSADIQNNIQLSAATKSPIQKIKNDLKSNRLREKSEINANRDYAKWREEVLTNQNNCALRCIQEDDTGEENEQVVAIEKLLNKHSNHINSTDHNKSESNSNQLENADKSNQLPASLSVDKRKCDSESELNRA